MNHFEAAPQVEIPRSKWPMPQRIKTSWNVGYCCPFYWSNVLPGDSWNVKTHKLIRMQTLKTPILDDLFLDTYYFFVPNRLIWEHWVNFMGESPQAWRPQVEYTVPTITAPEGGWSVGTVADYMGIPIGVDTEVNALPFRAYAKCIEDWFRDVNLQDAQVIEFGDSTVEGLNSGTNITTPSRGGTPFIAAKLHDYFTSCLPEPQRGPSVQVPIFDSEMPVYTIGHTNEYYARGADEDYTDWYPRLIANTYPVHYYGGQQNDPMAAGYNVAPSLQIYYHNQTDNEYYGLGSKIKGQPAAKDVDGNVLISGNQGTVAHIDVDLPEGPFVGLTNKEINDYFTNELESSPVSTFTPVNLVASSKFAGTMNINQLRTAFQIQRFYERSARGGDRYISILRSMFSVQSPDARQQRAEYLGGNRITVNIRQVIQTSETTQQRPLGDLAAISVTGDSNFDFEKSFTEHGYIIGIMVARYKHTYQQGIEPEWQRRTIWDFYWPTLAHIGEVGVTNQTLYATGNSLTDNEIFGYQEAWADYRYKPDRVSGMMRTESASGLDTWHLADYYTEQPYLSDDWIQEDAANVDRVLSVSSDVSDQLFGDIEVEAYVTRAMPLYSIPGLIDHF